MAITTAVRQTQVMLLRGVQKPAIDEIREQCLHHKTLRAVYLFYKMPALVEEHTRQLESLSSRYNIDVSSTDHEKRVYASLYHAQKENPELSKIELQHVVQVHHLALKALENSYKDWSQLIQMGRFRAENVLGNSLKK